MREILFRGKDKRTGAWLYGQIGKNSVGWYIVPNGDNFGTYVIHDTIGQDTGLKDKNGVKIFDGDIVREHANDYTPIYQNGIYMAYNVDKINDPYVSTQFNVIWRNGCEVIGNIHDNPELMEELDE